MLIYRYLHVCFESATPAVLYLASSLHSSEQIPGRDTQGDMMRTKKAQKGFSLIELLIVVAIILIIAAIAIPNLLRSKMAANEASAVGSMRTLNTASVTYSTTYGGYPHLLSNLAPASPATSTSADLVDSVLSGGTKTGYTFTFSAGTTDANGNYLNYSITAAPSSSGRERTTSISTPISRA